MLRRPRHGRGRRTVAWPRDMVCRDLCWSHIAWALEAPPTSSLASPPLPERAQDYGLRIVLVNDQRPAQLESDQTTLLTASTQSNTMFSARKDG